MLQLGARRRVSRKPRWINLQRDILELFCEAQNSVAEDARNVRAQLHEYRAYMSRAGFNGKERERLSSLEVVRSRNTKVWRPVRPEPEYPCPFCDIWSHTGAQRTQHIIYHHGGKAMLDEARDIEMISDSSFPNAVVYEGAESLKKAGWI